MKITNVVVEPMPRGKGPRGHRVLFTDELGHVGVGEAAPLPSYSADEIDAPPYLLADVGSRIAEVDDSVDAIDDRLAGFASTLHGAPATRFGLETALLDVLSKRKNVPISSLLSGNFARQRARVPVNGVIGTRGDIANWIADAHAVLARGIRVIKVKVGRSDLDFDREHAALRELRSALPADVEIRLDANGSFGDRARDRLAALANVRPSYVEEPARGAALAALGACAVPWAADESLVDRAGIDTFLQSACSVMVLKPALLGGVIYARKIALLARDKNIGAVVTHLFDGHVGHAAACELALSLASTESEMRACGLDAYDGLGDSPYLRTPGFVAPSGNIGLERTS